VSEVDEKTLTLVINVWMYYTVTDFPTRKYTESVLFAHRKESTLALKKRIKNKMEWETDDRPPYSELSGLLKKLKNE